MGDQEFEVAWDKDFDEALRLHRSAGVFAEIAQSESASRYEDSDPNLVDSALDVLSHDCALIHRSVAGVCMAGYSSVAPILVRTQLELVISTMAIVQHTSPEVMAFKYMYFAFKKGINDELFPPAERERSKRTCLEGLELLGQQFRDSAKKWVFSEPLPSFWYASEYGGPTSFLVKYLPGWTDFYRGLSAASHGGYIGNRLFRDEADEMTLEPRTPGRSAIQILNFSSRFMLDQTLYRAHFLELDTESAYTELTEELKQFAQRFSEPGITDDERRTLPTHQRIRSARKDGPRDA